MADKKNPAFLVMHKYHLSRHLAREAVTRTLADAGVQCPQEGWDSLSITWKDKDGQVTVSFGELVEEARQKGVVRRMQRYLDGKDSIFGHNMDEISTPIWQLKLKSEYAGFKKEVEGPCRCASVVIDLMTDILHYRSETCQFSDQHDFRLMTRAFRSYLSACVSIVEAFINRHILIAEHGGFTSPEFEELKGTTTTEKRVRLWYDFCCGDDPAPFFASIEWCHFQEIRKKRNEILHALDPFGMYSLREIHLYLNKVRTGVGGLMLRMRIAHGKRTLGFIERLRTAPVVDLMKIIFKDDGKHEIKPIAGN